MSLLSTCFRWVRVTGLLCGGCLSVCVSATSDNAHIKVQTPVVLATNINSSFTADVPDASSSDDVLPHIRCIFNRLNQPYNVRVMPWRRAYQDVKNNRIDGFFTALSMRQVDPYAVLSVPLLLENWYWFWREDTVAPESWRAGYKLGSILGSQQESWLEEAGYRVEITANNLPQLIRQLKSKRIDVLLADRDHFNQAIQELNLDAGHFKSRFFRYVPLGVYFNEAFLNVNPEFLTDFNRSVIDCSTTHFQISEYEREHIRELLVRKIERWRRLPGIEKLLKESNRRSHTRSQAMIDEIDKGWRAAFLRGDLAYANQWLDVGVSQALKEIKNESQGVVTEVMITDLQGVVVAVSDMTSDYWQGDEEKYTAVFGRPANALYFSDINYDESTKLFQIHLSIPLYDAADSIGVMVFGINVEKALSLIN